MEQILVRELYAHSIFLSLFLKSGFHCEMSKHFYTQFGSLSQTTHPAQGSKNACMCTYFCAGAEVNLINKGDMMAQEIWLSTVP